MTYRQIDRHTHSFAMESC